MTQAATQRVDRALLIGVDSYRYVWPPLTGCVADVDRLAEVLQQRLHTPADRITKLTAGRPGGEKPEQLATRANIVAALRALAGAAQPGEQVYVRRAVNRSPARNPLEELLARIGDGRGTRELIDCVSTGDWSTAELVLETTA
jgi:hypothetical protein